MGEVEVVLHSVAVLLLQILPEWSGPIGNSRVSNWNYDGSVDSMFVINPELQNQDKHWYPFWMSDIWSQAANKHRHACNTNYTK